MSRWIRVQDGMPNSEIACILLRREWNVNTVYPMFAEWDGSEWVDVEGDPVSCVVAWMPAPVYNRKLEVALSKLAGCVNKDSCEKQDCCYFAMADEISALLKYIETTGGQQNEGL